MSTPEDKLMAAASSIKADIAKVKTFWTDYRLYFVAVVCLIIGGMAGHRI